MNIGSMAGTQLLMPGTCSVSARLCSRPPSCDFYICCSSIAYREDNSKAQWGACQLTVIWCSVLELQMCVNSSMLYAAFVVGVLRNAFYDLRRTCCWRRNSFSSICWKVGLAFGSYAMHSSAKSCMVHCAYLVLNQKQWADLHQSALWNSAGPNRAWSTVLRFMAYSTVAAATT